MTQCNHLFRTEAIYAFYAETHVVIAADVWLNPYTDQAHICPNPIAMPPSREFLVEGTTKSTGIHPMLLVKHRVTYSYQSDATPQKVIVWSQGVDAPVRNEVALGDPPAAVEQPAKAPASVTPTPDAVAGTAANEVVGYSINFDYKEAIEDALAQARAKKPPRLPDIATLIEVRDVTARGGGNIKPGLFIKAVIK